MSDTNVHRVVGNLLVGTSHFFVDTTTNQVGVNTSTPGAALDVQGGDVKVGSGITLANNGTITATGFSGNGSGLTGVNSDSGSWVNGSSSNIHLAVSTDKVGIGTVSPAAELHVGGTGAIIVPSGTTGDRPATAANGMFRYNTETGYMESYTASGWGSIATPPTIQTISPASVAVADVTTQVFTVTGAFFDAQTTIQLQGADNTLYDVTDFVFTNSDSIGFKMGTLATGQAANRPYKVVVTNGAALSATSTATIGFVGLSWTSPAAGATLANFLTSGSANNTELAATDDLGGSAVTFSVPESNLPSGLTLNGSTGAITGQIGATGTTSVTFRITDNVSGSTLDRTFSIVGSTSLYAFSSPMEFTNAGATGYAGPTLSQLRSAYSPTWTDNSNYLNVTTQGYQLWTVPETGSYTIEAIGAKGGDQDGNGSGGVGGRGAKMKGTFSLTINEVITILVGQQGTWAARNSGGRSGGGGGTFVANSVNAPLIVAAGGGGWGGSGGNGKHGQASLTGLTGNYTSSSAAQPGSSGQANSNTGNGGWGSGGAAFYSNPGHDPNMYNGHTTTYYRASAFVNSGTGAYGDPGPSPNGGFGGGGGGAGNGGGGGGGWSGGGNSGGSGGSVNNGVALIASSGYNSTGHGSVIITKI